MDPPQPPDSQSDTGSSKRADTCAAALQLSRPVVRPMLSHHRIRFDRVEPQPFAWQLSRPEIVTVPLPRPQIRVVGCLFTDSNPAKGPIEALFGATEVKPATTNVSDREPPVTRRTRVRPPRDVLRLEDRLHYLLQPPLESVFRLQSLTFPFEPFGYQLDGVAFLFPRTEAVLADEMGLGKTMQAITALRLLIHQGGVRRALLVCPKPLVTNWQREFAQWAPELPVVAIEGKQSRRQWLWENADTGVLIANYESLVRDSQQVMELTPALDLMIIDEAQRIKNRHGVTNQVLCDVPRLRSWALTGTPIENSTDDLVGIFQFVSPGCLRPQMKTSSIRSVVSDYVLRRCKDQVLSDLPPKMFRDAEVTLTPKQIEAYQLAENEGIVRLHEMKAELTIQHVFELVLRLKQICNFDPATGASAKLDRLEADLEECAASGRKAIVFSQWVQTIEQLNDRLQRFGPLQYHGKIPSRHRDAVIECFRDDPSRSVLLMSYGTGSVGLNLQFASYVFLFDRWWNPAVEDQAINRVHRIGVAEPVTVTRFLTTGTIEERIDRILREKRELFHAVFDDSSPECNLGLSRDEILGLFNLEYPKP